MWLGSARAGGPQGRAAEASYVRDRVPGLRSGPRKGEINRNLSSRASGQNLFFLNSDSDSRR